VSAERLYQEGKEDYRGIIQSAKRKGVKVWGEGGKVLGRGKEKQWGAAVGP